MKKFFVLTLTALILTGCGSTLKEIGGSAVSEDTGNSVETMLTKSESLNTDNIRLVNDNLGGGINRWYCQSIALNAAPASAQIRVYADQKQENLLAKGLTAYDGTFALNLGSDIPDVVYISVQETGRLESDVVAIRK